MSFPPHLFHVPSMSFQGIKPYNLFYHNIKNRIDALYIRRNFQNSAFVVSLPKVNYFGIGKAWKYLQPHLTVTIFFLYGMKEIYSLAYGRL